MEAILETFKITATGLIILIIGFLILKWIFIYSVIKAAVKNGIIEAHDTINSNPPQKTIEEDFEDEINGWN